LIEIGHECRCDVRITNRKHRYCGASHRCSPGSPVDEPDYGELANVDAVIVGTWCGGLFFFGQHPGGAGKIAGELPDLWDKATFAFVTYAHNPGAAADKLGDVLEAMGSVNLGVGTIHRNRMEYDVAQFVDTVLAEFASA